MSSQERPSVMPSSSAEVFNPPDDDGVGRAWQLLRHLPMAAFGFALLAWVATGALAYQSETKGIWGATVAMFPSGFGMVGMIVQGTENQRLEAGHRPRAGMMIGLAFVGGISTMLAFGFFMVAVWPSL